MGAVAKRTLKKSYYDRAVTNTYNEDIYNIWNVNKGKEKSSEKIKSRKQKLLIQSLTVTTIVIVISSIKYFNMETIKNSEFSKNIIAEFNRDNSFSEIKKGTINLSNNIYKIISPIIPQDIINFFNNKQNNSVSIYDEEKNDFKIYEEDKNKKENIEKKEEKLIEGIGSSQEENKVITALSSINTEDGIIKKVKESKIKFVIPVKGTVSSNYGVREEIFQGIGTFHTGVDIATDKGTEVVSSTEGTVTVATYNKYNGNYVEITNGKIITKYCHMDKLLVKEGKRVKAGEKIGLVGSTGLSTGPHLHFELLYDGIKINPQKIIDL